MTKIFSRGAALLALAVSAFALSATAQGRGYGEVIVFKDPGFRGASLAIGGAVPNLAYERFNDTISSIEVRGAWEICTDPDYRGRCKIVEGGVHRLADIRMNDNITSLRPVSGRAFRHDRKDYRSRDYGYSDYAPRRGSGAVTLFKDPNYRGGAIDIDYAVRNLKDLRFNDTASSISIQSGTWLVCEHPDFRGRCEVVEGGVPHLSIFGLNDRITSLKRYRGERAGGGRGYRDNVGYQPRDRRDYRRDDGYREGYGPQTVQFDRPRDAYGNRIPARKRAARRFCRDQGFSQVVEIETRGDYLACVVCAY
ncbi:MAG: beta/gamma crystallin-related protein [Henriciella sp.]|nr:beta/gamma crystallin-related protein [Henriciella sp.]